MFYAVDGFVGEEEQELDELVDEDDEENADDVVGEIESAGEVTDEGCEKQNSPFKERFGAHGFILHSNSTLSTRQWNSQIWRPLCQVN